MSLQHLKYLFVLGICYIVGATQDILTSGNEDSVGLTKFLNIRVGQNADNNVQSNLRENLRAEVRNALRDVDYDLVEPRNSYRHNARLSRNEDLEIFVDNIVAKFQALLISLEKLMKSEIYSVKNNVCINSNFNSNIKNFINKSPVGVSFNQVLQLQNVNQPDKTITNIPKNCKDIFQKGNNASGIYKIQPNKSEKPFMVLCDMETRGGGWTHIHKRFDGSQDFFLEHRDYKFGFGDLEREFWLGLENIYLLTDSEINELLVEIVDRDNKKVYAHYKAFKVGPGVDGYTLSALNGYSGDAGDSLNYHLGAKFTTKDFDQDINPANCAILQSGAWWYKSCCTSNLNGKYINADVPPPYKIHGMNWDGFRGHDYVHSKARMMVRPA